MENAYTPWVPSSSGKDASKGRIQTDELRSLNLGGLQPISFDVSSRPEWIKRRELDADSRTMPFLGNIRSNKHFLDPERKQVAESEQIYSQVQLTLVFVGEFIVGDIVHTLPEW